VLSRAQFSTLANFSVKRKACFSDTSSGSGALALNLCNGLPSACQPPHRHASLVPRPSPSPSPPRHRRPRLISPSDLDSQLSGCHCRCCCRCHCSQELSTDQWRSPPGPREGNLGILWRTDRSLAGTSLPIGAANPPPTISPHSSDGSTHPPSPACCSCHSRSQSPMS
jgi:hypothetical protein